jgi:hypothetical protein
MNHDSQERPQPVGVGGRHPGGHPAVDDDGDPGSNTREQEVVLFQRLQISLRPQGLIA